VGTAHPTFILIVLIMSYRPDIQIVPSRWEIFLALAILIVVAIGLVYAIVNWRNTPVTIQFPDSNKFRELDRLTFWILYTLKSLALMVIGNYYIFFTNRKNYYGGRTVSKDRRKNILQYKIEASCLLCEFFLIVLGSLMDAITRIESQISNNYPLKTSFSFILDIKKQIEYVQIPNVWLVSFLSIMIAIWSIHHILWTRLSDK
jgi:hypothetical protein